MGVQGHGAGCSLVARRRGSLRAYAHVIDLPRLHRLIRRSTQLRTVAAPTVEPQYAPDLRYADERTDGNLRLTDEHRRTYAMSPIRRFDHVGITVRDLDVVTDFFVGLGFRTEGRTVLEGGFLHAVVGIPQGRTEMVVLRPPGGGTGLELSRFLHPAQEPGSAEPMPTELGLRNVTFEVDDLEAILDRLSADGYHLVGGVGHQEGTWRMASVRGPEGFI